MNRRNKPDMEKNTSSQIAELNQKVDTILEYVNQQRLKSQAMEDLIADVSIIGKDVYDSTVRALDAHEVKLEPDELRELAIRFVQNIGNFNRMLDTLGSAIDMMKDVGPIAKEVIIDATKKLHRVEQKGYFDFLREFGHVIDNIVTKYRAEDVRLLADNVVAIMDTIKNLTQPEMLKSVDNAVRVFSSLEMENIPEYSVFRLMREMRKPEMKKALGFFVIFMRNLSKGDIN
jgi:uncharacterized protein YjgD (DUF1641 family)